MDSTELLLSDLLGENASPDNNMPYDHANFENFFDQLSDPTIVKEEPQDMGAEYQELLPTHVDAKEASMPGSEEDEEYDGIDMPLDGLLSSPKTESSREAALPVVTTGEQMTSKRSSSRGKQEPKKSKRSRRVRTPKQQELNRLAQQRYRERKKQKYSSLQQAVDALSVQLERVAVVEEERDNLQAEKEDLQLLLKQQTSKLHNRESVITKQQKMINDQQAEIAALKQRLNALPAADSATDLRLLQHLGSVINTAITTALEEHGCKSAMVGPLSKVLMDKIKNTVGQCCREITTEPATTKPLPQVVQVSCC